jgi:phosphomevalonate kinase
VTTAIASAPGKVIISGEYAVMEGSAAICMAIDKRARAEVSITTADFQAVRTSGYINGAWRFLANGDGDFEWAGDEPPEGSLDLLREVWASMGVNGSFDIRLDTAEFFDPLSGSKLGLGSSAALTVALVAAFSKVTKRADINKMAAAEAHRRLQHGRGSGVDIAASFTGGVIEYRMADTAICRQTRWPAGLEYSILWSGLPASTSEKLRKFDEARRSQRSTPSTRRLCDAAESTASCWSAGDALELLESFRCYIEALMQFDVDHDLGIFAAGHKELAVAAAKRKLVYKPCGAGGGDTGIVFSTDKRAIAEFADIAGKRGYRSLDVKLEADGVILED